MAPNSPQALEQQSSKSMVSQCFRPVTMGTKAHHRTEKRICNVVDSHVLQTSMQNNTATTLQWTTTTILFKLGNNTIYKHACRDYQPWSSTPRAMLQNEQWRTRTGMIKQCYAMMRAQTTRYQHSNNQEHPTNKTQDSTPAASLNTTQEQ